MAVLEDVAVTARLVEVLNLGIGSCDVGVTLICSCRGFAVYAHQVTAVEEDVSITADEVYRSLYLTVLEVELSCIGVRVVGVLIRGKTDVLTYRVVSLVLKGCSLSLVAAIGEVVLQREVLKIGARSFDNDG